MALTFSQTSVTKNKTTDFLFIFPVFFFYLTLSIQPAFSEGPALSDRQVLFSELRTNYDLYTKNLSEFGEKDCRTLQVLERLKTLSEKAITASPSEERISSATNESISDKTGDSTEVHVSNITPPFYSGTPKPVEADLKMNYCGNYALSTIFSWLGIDSDFDRIVRDMNPASLYTAPVHLIEYARKRGAPARGHNNTTFDELKAQIDAGRPAALLISCSGGVSTAHWIVVSGYRTVNGKTEWKIMDSYYGADSKTGYIWMSQEELAKKWGSLTGDPVLESLISYKNYAVFFDGQNSFASACETSFEDSFLGALDDIVVAWHNKSLGSGIAALSKAAAGITAFPWCLTGRFIDISGRTISNWGKNLASSDSLTSRIIGTGAFCLGRTISIHGKVLDYFGRGIAWAGNTLSSLFK